jgi:hypothetical protein
MRKNPNLKIFFLTGSRPLNEYVDTDNIGAKLEKNGLPPTEEFAARSLWDEYFGKMPCEFVNVDQDRELHKAPDELKRANTKDTIEKLLRKSNLVPGKMLAISTNPFISFQHNVLRNQLEKVSWFLHGGTLETVGPCVDIDWYCHALGKQNCANILLDNVARCAYEEIKQLTSVEKTALEKEGK